MTWRERIQVARERGSFAPEDRLAWLSPRQCMVGDAKNSYASFNGVGQPLVFNDAVWRAAHREHFTMTARARRALKSYAALTEPSSAKPTKRPRA